MDPLFILLLIFAICVIVVLIAVGMHLHKLWIEEVKQQQRSIRKEQLIIEAQTRWPGFPLSESLGLLYDEKCREMSEIKRQDGDIKPIIRDHFLLAEERLRIWREEETQFVRSVEQQSGFAIIHSAEL